MGHEMEKCYVNFQWELEAFNPSTIFLLGRQVATFVLKKFGISDFCLDDKFNFSPFIINDMEFVPVHHPSYILVYKRKQVDQYIRGIQSLLPVKESTIKKRA